MRRENAELRNQAPDGSELRRQIVQLQSEKALALQEVERLTGIVKTKDMELEQLRRLSG